MLIIGKRQLRLAIGIGFLGWTVVVHAAAEPVSHNNDIEKTIEQNDRKQQWIPHVNIDGNIRSYYFVRNYGIDTPNQSTFSLGGKLNLLTDLFWNNFRVGATLYTAQPLGMNASNPAQVDKTVPGTPLTVLGQTYLQYQNSLFLARVGNQLVKTPWIHDEDSRMIPSAYQGIYTELSPTKDLSFTAMRLIRFKSQIASSFSQTNLFNPENNGSIAALRGQTTIGAAALGAHYHHNNVKSQLWGYQFYDYAKLVYGDVDYTLATSNYIKPKIGLQIAHEWNDGNAVIERLGFGKINATAYGILLGVEAGNGQINIGYNNIPERSNAYYQHGNLMSPYTSGADPLYTTSMIAGLTDKGTGSAYKVGAEYYVYHRQVLLKASYAKYNTAPFAADTTETNFDAKYQIGSGRLKDLFIRARLGILNGDVSIGKFIYTRLMLQYDFT